MTNYSAYNLSRPSESSTIEKQGLFVDLDRASINSGQHPLLLQRALAIPRQPSCSPAEFFLCVSVKEAIGLTPAVPMFPATCDSFVRVTLASPGQGTLPLAEAETRVITRNCNPMWEERLPFLLDQVTDDTNLILRVMDKDIGHINSFLGTVSLSLHGALDYIKQVHQEKEFRCPLLDRQGNARTKGELKFGITMIPKREYDEVRNRIDILQEPDKVHGNLRDYCLHLKLHSLKELCGVSAGMVSSLAVDVNVCSFETRKPLTGQLVEGDLNLDDVEVVVPLGRAFRDGDMLKGKNRAQFGEIKVKLMAGRTRLAKTQVPIWDVPVRCVKESGDEQEKGEASGEARQPSPDRRSSDPIRPSSNGGGTALDLGLRPVSEMTAAATAIGRRLSDIGPAGTETQQQPGVPTEAGATSGVAVPPSPPAPAAASSKPLWDGKSYHRRMERMDRSLAQAPLAVFSMQLVKAEPGEVVAQLATTTITSGGAAGGNVFDGADVDSPAEPLAVPPFEGMSVADFVVAVGPLTLLKMLYEEGAELAGRVWDREKVTAIKTGPWGADPDAKAICQRSLNYMKPSPVGPVAVQSQQKVVLKNSSGFVLHQYVTPHVPPVGPCVRVFAQIVGQHAGPNKTRFTAAIKLEWFKSGMMVNMLKGKIEDATPKDTCKFFDSVRAELATKFTIENAASVAGGGAAASAGAAAAACAASVVAAGGGSSASAAGDGIIGQTLQLLSNSPLGFSLAVGVALLLLLLLLLGLWQLAGAVRQAREELAGSQRALNDVSRALEMLTAQLKALASATAAANPPACVMP